ncbi:MAG: TetR/AcrR family transcriptional regulator [Marinobacter sp.]|uniref:TetR/AcrR family transcriptional regulator n=1 Tax=Marinobacter sp. TaxID=50741 RepID=UPI00299F4036|nr:TetR/AcrR family transcriptional regulator [Marinobacter sp.]MDX1636264.1 TetR/AcrR family transcriptional regulator [Marinobacter sp.]
MGYQDEAFQQRERVLLDTALALFRDRGWEQVTVAQVAEAAGIGKGTVYKHFATKESIYARLALEFSRRCLSQYRRVVIGDRALVSMREVIRQAFDLMCDNPIEVQLSLHCERPEFQERLDAGLRADFGELEQQYTELFNHFIEVAVSRGEMAPVSTEALYWGIEAGFHGVMARVAAGGFGAGCNMPDLARYLDHVADFMIAGLLGAPAVAATTARSTSSKDQKEPRS